MPVETAQSASVTDALIDLLRQRQAKGVATYGTSLMTFNGRDPVRDALEEAVDIAQYLMQIGMERQALEAERNALRARLVAAEAVCEELRTDLDHGPEWMKVGRKCRMALEAYERQSHTPTPAAADGGSAAEVQDAP